MAFTAVSAGELIKASIANANWRHVGRLGADMLPFTVAGAGVDDTWDLGSATYQWQDLYLSATGKIYIGGVEFTGGSGGAGGGLDIVALANQQEKLGQAVTLTSPNVLRNAYVVDTNMQFWLREAYTTADTTTMIADRGLESELETINDFETIGDFTAGTSTPTLGADTTNFIYDSQSIKFTANSLSGSADMYETVTLSLTDRHFRVSVRPDIITPDVSDFYVILYTSSGNQRKFSFTASDLTQEAWNTLTCDIDDSTAYTDTGTFVRSNITRIYYGVTTTDTQTVVPSWDLARAISKEPLLIPSHGFSMSIQDATNQESFSVVGETRTNNVTKGTFTIGATLTNNYTNIETTAYASTTGGGDISNNQFQVKSTASGQEAKTPKQHDVLYLNTTLASGTLEAFLRYYDDAFEVTDLSSFASAGTIDLYSDTDLLAIFDDDAYIILFKKLRGGYRDQSSEGSSSVNFWVLQQSAAGSYSDPTITVTMDKYLSDYTDGTFTTGKPTLGADLTGYYVVPYSAYMSYIAGTKTASTITRLWPSEFLVKNINIPFPENVVGHWQFDQSTGTVKDQKNTYDFPVTGTLTVSSGGKFGRRSSNFVAGTNYLTNTESAIIGAGGTESFAIEVWTTLVQNSTYQFCFSQGADSSKMNLVIWNDNTLRFGLPNTASGYYVSLASGTLANYVDGEEHHVVGIYDKDDATNKFQLAVDGAIVALGGALTAFTGGTQTYFGQNSVNSHAWDGKLEQATIWRGSIPTTSQISERYANGIGRNYGSSSGGYMLKHKVTDLTDVDKLETIKSLDITDTSTQDPIIYEDGAILY